MLKALSLPGLFLSLNSHSKKKNYIHDIHAAARPGLFWLGAVLTAANFCLLFSYLAGVNGRSQQGFEIKQIQTRVTQLNEQKAKLDFKITEASSILSGQSNFSGFHFVSMGTPRLLELDSSKFSYNANAN